MTKPGQCPACKHDRHLHMRDKHKSWSPLERASCACTCGCGVTREEIDDYHKKAQSNDRG